MSAFDPKRTLNDQLQKRTLLPATSVKSHLTVFDPKRTVNDQLQKRWFELVPPYGSGVVHLRTAAFGTKRPLDKS